MGEKSLFLTEEEYKEEIHDLFAVFDFDTPERMAAGEEVPLDQQCIDVNIVKMLFAALNKPLSAAALKMIDSDIQKRELPGCSYPLFEKNYLQAFPYKTDRLLEESFRVFSGDKDEMTLEDMRRVVKQIHSDFPDQDLAIIARVFGTGGKISLNRIRQEFC